MAFPKTNKPVGFKHKQREGDYLVTYEVVEHNKKNGCNVWEEVKRVYKPITTLNNVIEAIGRERDYEYTKQLRKAIL